jgi:hypothetical protein
MPTVRAQLEAPVAPRCRIRDHHERKPAASAPYTDREIDTFVLGVAAALSRPGAFDLTLDRIDELLKNAKRGL